MKRKEMQNVEFKQSWRDEFLKEICGFANAKGGTLLVGVDDSGKAVGVENGKRLMEDIPNKIVSLLGIVPDVNLVDKNGVEIKAGMTIRMEDGSLELVYDTTDSYGNPDLGINASNEDYLELHPFASREFYSLCNFDMRYTEVVDDQTVAENNFEQSM